VGVESSDWNGVESERNGNGVGVDSSDWHGVESERNGNGVGPDEDCGKRI
jgi:hypothetical protein